MWVGEVYRGSCEEFWEVHCVGEGERCRSWCEAERQVILTEIDWCRGRGRERDKEGKDRDEWAKEQEAVESSTYLSHHIPPYTHIPSCTVAYTKGGKGMMGKEGEMCGRGGRLYWWLGGGDTGEGRRGVMAGRACVRDKREIKERGRGGEEGGGEAGSCGAQAATYTCRYSHTAEEPISVHRQTHQILI